MVLGVPSTTTTRAAKEKKEQFKMQLAARVASGNLNRSIEDWADDDDFSIGLEDLDFQSNPTTNVQTRHRDSLSSFRSDR